MPYYHYEVLLEPQCTFPVSYTHLIEDTNIVDDQSMSFTLIIGPVSTADGLKERVIFHWLIEIHYLKDRRIKAGQQLCGDNNKLERTVSVSYTHLDVYKRQVLSPRR